MIVVIGYGGKGLLVALDSYYKVNYPLINTKVRCRRNVHKNNMLFLMKLKRRLLHVVPTILLHFLSFFPLWGGLRSLHMPVLRPASWADPMRNPRDGTSVM